MAITDFVRRLPNPVELSQPIDEDPPRQFINDFFRLLIDLSYCKHDFTSFLLRLDWIRRFEGRRTNS
jgi:hypothetical protein